MLERKLQNTLDGEACFVGLGLHSGKPVALTVRPAPPNHGIVFLRTDITRTDNRIPAVWDSIVDTRYCTVLGSSSGVTIATVEHLLSAMSAIGIDNAEVHCTGPEIPILDGSAAGFLEHLEAIGIRVQSASRHYIRIDTPVIYREHGRYAALYPADRTTFEIEIDFKHPEIGKQRATFDGSLESYRRDIACARTFGFERDLEHLRNSGLALGGSLRNAVLVTERSFLNQEGLRHPHEFARHKLLDSFGDLALAGAGLKGQYVSYQPGHALNRGLLDKLFSVSQYRGYRSTRLKP